MNEINCPNCNKAFKVDEASFADILKQVHDHHLKKKFLTDLHSPKKKRKVRKPTSFSKSKADDLTIKRLTHGNPTMKAKFDELNNQWRQTENEC